MSLLNISFLNEAVNEKKIDNPSSILEHVRARVMQALVEDIGGGKDGMDCIISSFNLKTNELRFACANNPLWILRNGTIIEFKPDKFPVGKHDGDLRPFTLQTFNLQTGDLLYLFTDGYADQFGGPSGKKFKYKQLQQLITKNAYLPMNEQEKMFNRVFEEWKGSLEQVDDILLIGVRI